MKLAAAYCVDLLVSCAICRAATALPPKEPRLSLEVSKKRYIVGEPMLVRLRLGSETSEVAAVFDSNADFERQAGFLFTVTALDGSLAARTNVHTPDAGRLSGHRPPLRPAGSFWQCEKMFLPLTERVGPREPRLLRAGAYDLAARLWWEPSSVAPGNESGEQGSFLIAGPVRVEVVEPTERDAEAVKLLDPPGIIGFFDGWHGGKPDPIAALLDRFPDSPYAQPARTRLLLDRIRSLWDTKRSGLSGSERREAGALISQAQEYARANPGGMLSDNMLLYRARMQMILREKEAAAQTLLGLVRDYPEGDAAEAALAWLEKVPEEVKQALSKAAPVPEKPSTETASSPKAASPGTPKEAPKESPNASLPAPTPTQADPDHRSALPMVVVVGCLAAAAIVACVLALKRRSRTARERE